MRHGTKNYVTVNLEQSCDVCRDVQSSRRCNPSIYPCTHTHTHTHTHTQLHVLYQAATHGLKLTLTLTATLLTTATATGRHPVLSVQCSLCFSLWYGMVNDDLYSAIITKVTNALNTLVSSEKPCFQKRTHSLGLADD